MTEEYDVQRSENEGMCMTDPEHQFKVNVFLDRVKEKFIENQSFKHLEDAARDLVEHMEGDERKNYLGFDEDFSFLMESFLGPQALEKWKELETNRILEFEELDSNGVG